MGGHSRTGTKEARRPAFFLWERTAAMWADNGHRCVRDGIRARQNVSKDGIMIARAFHGAIVSRETMTA